MKLSVNCICSASRDVSLSNSNGVYEDATSVPMNASPTWNCVGSSGFAAVTPGMSALFTRVAALVVLAHAECQVQRSVR